MKLPSSSSSPTSSTETLSPHQYTGAKTHRHLLLKVSYLGVAFSLIFTGYNVSQSFVTTLHHSAGFAALCVIYSTYAVSSLFAPIVNLWFEEVFGDGNGEKCSMIISGFSYVVFIVLLSTGSKSLLFLGSVIKGFGSGLLWISQGVWVNKAIKGFKRYCRDSGVKHDKDIVGLVTGVFFTLFNLNSIVGNLLVIGLMSNGVSLSFMVLAMALVSALGTFMFIFASKAPNKHRDVVDVEDANKGVGVSNESVNSLKVNKVSVFSAVSEKIKSIIAIAFKTKTLLLTPYLICQGVSMAYTYGNYPHFIKYVSETQPNITETQVAVNISYGFLAYGLGSVIGSYGWGKLYDFFHGVLYPLLGAHFVLVAVNFSLLAAVIAYPVTYPTSLFPCLILVGFIIGLVDFLSNAIINNSITRGYESEEVSTAFSWYRFCYCVGFAGASGISSFVPSIIEGDGGPNSYGWILMIAFNVFFMLLSVSCGSILEYNSEQLGNRRRSSTSVPLH